LRPHHRGGETPFENRRHRPRRSRDDGPPTWKRTNRREIWGKDAIPQVSWRREFVGGPTLGVRDGPLSFGDAQRRRADQPRRTQKVSGRPFGPGAGGNSCCDGHWTDSAFRELGRLCAVNPDPGCGNAFRVGSWPRPCPALSTALRGRFDQFRGKNPESEPFPMKWGFGRSSRSTWGSRSGPLALRVGPTRKPATGHPRRSFRPRPLWKAGAIGFKPVQLRRPVTRTGPINPPRGRDHPPAVRSADVAPGPSSSNISLGFAISGSCSIFPVPLFHERNHGPGQPTSRAPPAPRFVARRSGR